MIGETVTYGKCGRVCMSRTSDEHFGKLFGTILCRKWTHVDLKFYKTNLVENILVRCNEFTKNL